MKYRYHHPPILEAVCEIHFEPSHPLTEERINEVANIWKDLYPQQRTIEETKVEFQIALGSATVQRNNIGKRLIATAASGTKLVQLSSQFLAVNQLKPYTGWLAGFRADILARSAELSTYVDIKKIHRISLRYIDRLDLPQRPLNWKEWFSITLPLPNRVPQVGGLFQSHFQQELEVDLKLTSIMVTLPFEGIDSTSILLDSTITWEGAITFGEITDILERVHGPLPALFHEVLTPKSQELLGVYEAVS